MKLVIDIPEEIYKKAKETHDVMCDSVWLGIKYGTPLEESEDCVSRQAVLDLVNTIETDDYNGNEIVDVVEFEDIKQLPPVTPAERVGQWIKDDDDYEYFWRCNKCSKRSDVRWEYCPNCGAKMGGGQE